MALGRSGKVGSSGAPSPHGRSKVNCFQKTSTCFVSQNRLYFIMEKKICQCSGRKSREIFRISHTYHIPVGSADAAKNGPDTLFGRTRAVLQPSCAGASARDVVVHVHEVADGADSVGDVGIAVDGVLDGAAGHGKVDHNP